jgi:hypothetical protein
MIFYEEIFRAFRKQKVKYLLVGGIAVNLFGAMRSLAGLGALQGESLQDEPRLREHELLF